MLKINLIYAWHQCGVPMYKEICGLLEHLDDFWDNITIM